MTLMASHWNASTIRRMIAAVYVGGSKIFAPLPLVSGPAVRAGLVIVPALHVDVVADIDWVTAVSAARTLVKYSSTLTWSLFPRRFTSEVASPVTSSRTLFRSEERRVGKECRSRWS